MHDVSRLFFFVTMLLVGMCIETPLQAEEQEHRHIHLAAISGVLELYAFREKHLGLYGFTGPALVIPVGLHANIIPSFSVGWAPENGHWGAVGTLTYDQPLTHWFALDVNLIIGEDHIGRFRELQPIAAFGLGASFFFNKTVALAPSMNWAPGPAKGALVPSLAVVCLFP